MGRLFKRFGGFDIDDQLDLRCLLDRQFGRLFTLENAACLDAEESYGIYEAASVAHQAAPTGKLGKLIDRRYAADLTRKKPGTLTAGASFFSEVECSSAELSPRLPPMSDVPDPVATAQD